MATGQKVDTTFTSSRPSMTPAFITGAMLVGTGVIVNKDATKNSVRDWVRERYDIPNTSIDDILQHSPIAMIYIADLALGSDKKKVGRHTRHLITTQALTLGTMLLAKEITNTPRPNGASHAFPSGHTAYTFASAGVMYQSFKDDNLLLAYSGYLPAITVGAYRMIKDKHWISDVLVGAGMGILFSHLTYHFDIWHSRTDKHGKKDFMSDHTSVNVSFGTAPGGVGLSVQF